MVVVMVLFLLAATAARAKTRGTAGAPWARIAVVGQHSADAVVIGAGHNGLVAANMLADAGWSVVVLEEQDQPGGAVRTAPLTAPGFANDLYSSFYPLATARSPLTALALEDEGLRWCRSETVLTHVAADGGAATLSTDLAETEASVDGWHAGDGRRWRSVYRDWLRVERELFRVLYTPFPPVRSTARLLRTAGIGDALRLARRLILPASTLGRELFAGEGARLLISGLALHADAPLTSAASGGYGLLMAMLAQHRGFPVPVGGASSLTDALVARLRRRGGEVICGVAATRVQVRHGVAWGVATAGGDTYRGRRAVLADVSATALYQHLLSPAAVPARLLGDLLHFHYDPSTVKVDWALDGPVPWANAGAGRSGTIHIGADRAGLEAYSSAIHAGRVPEQPFLICGQMTTADPTRSPSGTEAFWCYTRLPHRRRWSASEVSRVVQRIEAVLEASAPGFSGRVLARHVAGPVQLEDGDASLVGGALSGGTSAVHQQLFFRPVPGLGRADTPVDRLFLASASTHPGGGVHGAPGANAARAALARDRAVTGRLYRGTVQALQRRIYAT